MSQMILVFFLSIFLNIRLQVNSFIHVYFSVKTKTCTYNQYEYDVDEKRTEGSCVEW